MFRLPHIAALVVLALLPAACDRGASTENPPAVPQGELLEIPFAATLAGQPVSCASETLPRITDLRFYVSAVEVNTAANGWQPAPIELVEGWQNAHVALIDFEDGAGHCAGGSPGTHTTLRVRTPTPDVAGLRFTVGVPFEVNHADPAEAEAPLDETAMHWTWNAGYRFVRVEAESEAGHFLGHLGSTNCQGTVGNITGCRHENRARAVVEGWTPGQTVALDLDRLLLDVPFASGSAGCMGSNTDERCTAVYRNLGVDPETGAATPVTGLFVAR